MPAKGGSGNDGPFISWTQITTWHGMYDLFSKKHCLAKCIWTFVMVFTTYMFMLQVTQLMVDFVDGNKWGTSSYDEAPSNGMVFPNVTICDINLVSEQRMRKMNMSVKLVEYMMEGLSPFSNELKWVPDNETRDNYEKVMRQEYLDWVGNDTYMDLKEWLRKLASSCEETIKQCSMGKGNRRLWFDCCSNAREIFFVDYGICFVLYVPTNITDVIIQDQAGTINGMTLHLDPNLEHYAKLDVQTDQGAGFMLAMGYDPEFSIVSSPVVLRPGTHSWLAMTAVEERTTYFGNGRHVFFDILEKINPLAMFNADLPCIPNGKLEVVSGPYLYETCIEDCVVKQIVKMCGCAPVNPTQDHIKTCDPPTSQSCVAEFWQNRTTETNALHLDASRCSANCSTPCSRSYVTIRNSATQWPAPNHVKAIQRQLSVTEGKMPTEANVKNRILVDIYFESTQIHVTEMSEQRTIVGLVSNIGGNLGVWAGISVVTLFQAMVMITNVIRLAINQRSKEVLHSNHRAASAVNHAG